MDWLQWLLPAAIGAATSLLVTLVTTRAQLKREREELDAKLKADVDSWKREFAEAAARGPSHTRLLAQQFRVGYISLLRPGGASSERHFIPANTTITIGRGVDSNIRILDDDRMISSTHALVEANESGIFFVDMSTNGTMLNGSLVGPTRRKLTAGDVLEIGSVRATFHPLD